MSIYRGWTMDPARLGGPVEECGRVTQDEKTMNPTSPVSVVIGCHTQERLQHLLLAIESVRAQDLVPESIVISVDHEPALFRLLCDRFPDLQIVENEFERGASGNRNSGVAHTSTPIVAFLDDDARARQDWLSALVEPFSDPRVVCTGGLVVPSWEGVEPPWFPSEFAWVVGASHRGLPEARAEVRNVWSENMAVRREVFRMVGGFRVDFGKVGTVSRPEDTDLCIRLGKARPGAILLLVPEAVVDHHVGRERAAFTFFLRRCYFEGRGKIELARNNEGSADLGDERRYLRQTIPRGLAGYIRRGVADGNFNEIRRSGALISGLGAAGVGAAVSLLGGLKLGLQRRHR
jgi:GT2 family glycosyltransferase